MGFSPLDLPPEYEADAEAFYDALLASVPRPDMTPDEAAALIEWARFAGHESTDDVEGPDISGLVATE